RHRQRRQRHTQPGPRGLVHLAEDQGGVRKDTHLVHLQEEVRTLTGALTDTGEHGHTTEVAGDTGDHLLDQYRLAHTGTTEQTDLPTTHVRGEQVDHLDTGDQHLGLGLELVEVRGLAVDRPVLGHLQLRAGHIHGIAQRVEHVTLDPDTDRDADRGRGVPDLGTTDQPVLGGQGDGPDDVVTQVLGDLEGDGLGLAAERDVGVQSVVDVGEGTDGELHVDDRAGDPGDTASGGGA